MTEKKYHCFDCKKELKDIEVSYVRLHQMIDYSYDLKTKNKKLIDYIKSQRITEDAVNILKEVGEYE